jgi:hypothetical protein
VGSDLVAQDEAGAGIAGVGGGELLAEGGKCLGAPGRGERVEPDDQFTGTGPDVVEMVRASRISAYASSPTRA